MAEFSADIERRDVVEGWRAITDRGGCPGVFSCLPWVAAWAAAFADRLVPEIGLAGDSGSIQGILPLFRRDDGLLTTPVNFVSHRGELVCLPGREQEVAASILRSARSRGETLLMRGLPAGSGTDRAVRGVASPSGYIAVEREGRSSPVVDVAGDWESYYEGRPRKVTHEWERKIRKLDRAGEVTVHVYDGGDTDELVTAFADLEDGSWKDDTGTSIRGRGMESFYRDVSRRLDEAGWFRPWWVELDGRMIAFLYGVELGGTYYALKTSYLKRVAKLSPGVRLFRDAVRDVFERGLDRFDFVGQPARWKDEWANDRLEHSDLTLYPDDASGRARALVEGRIKPAARAVRDSVSGRGGDGRS
ncbi:MAG: GNAT family N-acetyltransferase [Candidatus Eisenbacteria bacterium]|nr:GNAT family N-acetyltransferase [Candidatus Eisenbacteria bacterium]